MSTKKDMIKFISISLAFNLALISSVLMIANEFFGVSLDF